MIAKTVFIGTPQFSVPCLDDLINSEFKPELVITQPDRPKGRKLVLCSPEVKILADKYNIPILQPDNINDQAVIAKLKEINPDIIITISYGGYIGKEIRKLPTYGVINIHPSILPLYRGSTPIQNTLLNGDSETAITIFKLISKMDAGPILYQKRYPVSYTINHNELEKSLAETAGKDLLRFLRFVNKLNSIDDYLNIMITQSTDNVKDTVKVSHETRKLNWDNKANVIINHIRAYALIPGAYTYLRDKPLKILKASLSDIKSSNSFGVISAIEKHKGFYVSTHDFDILIELVQPEGKKIMTSHDYNLGARLIIGERFTNGL